MANQAELLGHVRRASEAGRLSAAAAESIENWLTAAAYEPFRAQLIAEIEAEHWVELDNAFYTTLEFGTGGRRGRMYPVGTNVLNDRTIAESARGLADYVTGRKGAASSRSCVIAYDTRHQSMRFAEICASTMIAAGFRIFLFAGFRSTPLLSFAVRHLGCDAGIMITASHNPPSDNGFKCYGSTGGQVIPPDDSGIIDCVKSAANGEIPLADLDAAKASGTLKIVGEEIDRAYLEAAVQVSVAPERDLKIVYTPMHGVGETVVAALLHHAGFVDVDILASQRTPDGDFPNIPGHVSNPEIPKTLQAAIEQARAESADLVIASDPDADRIGVAVPRTNDRAGDWTTLTGNQIGVLLSAFVIDRMNHDGRLLAGHFLVTTLVTSEMAGELARQAGVSVEHDLLVGFKWIAARIDEKGPDDFLFGFEESHGYLRGLHARDKDAGVAALLMAELAAHLKSKGQSVLAYLDDLYLRAGHYLEDQINIYLEGREGVAQTQKLMQAFRDSPPQQIAGLPVVAISDYKTGVRLQFGSSASEQVITQPRGDLLIFQLGSAGNRFAVRPSGTEPKVKIYLFARTETSDLTAGGPDLEQRKQASRMTLDRMIQDLQAYQRQVLG